MRKKEKGSGEGHEDQRSLNVWKVKEMKMKLHLAQLGRKRGKKKKGQ